MKMNMELWWNFTQQGKPKLSERNLPLRTSFTTHLTWNTSGSFPGIRNKKLASDRLFQSKAALTMQFVRTCMNVPVRQRYIYICVCVCVCVCIVFLSAFESK